MIAKLAAVVAALAISAGVMAAPAQASPSSYLDDLSSSPWGFTGPIETWLAIGYAVCHRIEMGYNQTDLVNFVVHPREGAPTFRPLRRGSSTGIDRYSRANRVDLSGLVGTP